MVTPQLTAAIEAAYVVLRTPAPRSIESCPCCSDKEALCRLLKTKLRDLTPNQLSDYAMSVFWTVGGEGDFRYFLPRLLEISSTERDWWPSPEIILKKLALAHWLKWTVKEREAIESLLAAWFESVLGESPLDGGALDSVICGIAISGVPMEPYLQTLVSHPNALATYYERNAYALWKGRKLMNEFWSQDRSSSLPIVSFIMSDRVQEILRQSHPN